MSPIKKTFYELKPTDCLKLSFEQSVELIKNLIGNNRFELAKKFQIKSPLIKEKNTQWLKETKIIGINPRITKTYWGIVKYAMTFPEQGIHIMPLFESGDGSIYVQNSWKLNPDFYDNDLEKLGFTTCKEQLLFVINILHAMGKYVGFDALPHVDNFSEIAILNPRCFEWAKLNENKTSEDFSADRNITYKEVENILIQKYNLSKDFFEQDEGKRQEALFPENINRFDKRMEIRKLLRDNGFEPVPVVEHSPMRPIIFEKIEYSNDENWAVFKIPDKSSFAKVLGSITPYAWYDIDENGFIKKNSRKKEVWDYFCNHIFEFQKFFDFDFLRADMAHNQISHSHNEKKDLKTEEFWAVLKDKINAEKPYFASFGEGFFSTYYINAHNDMTNKKFDSVLGNLNFQYLNENYTEQIYKMFQEYKQNSYTPCNTIYTNDGDLPKHQSLYQSQDANILRFFTAIFMKNTSYMGMGFECRNLFPEKNSEFSNYYVKQQSIDFQFGQNDELYKNILQIRKLYENYQETILSSDMKTYITNSNKVFAWSYSHKKKNLLFIVNLDIDIENIKINNLELLNPVIKYTNSQISEINIESDSDKISFSGIQIGECAVYEY